MAPILLRPPTFSKISQPDSYNNPSIPWLSDQWHVTHSTLPMWKDKRNVRITYTPLDPSTPSLAEEETDRLDDLVTYQSNKSEKVSTVHGVEKIAGKTESRGEWDWRGKGLLKIAGSHWEVLGWGEEEGTGNKWIVTMFAKTLFTPAGIDIYSQEKSGLQAATLEGIKQALAESKDKVVQAMSGEIFEITIEDARQD